MRRGVLPTSRVMCHHLSPTIVQEAPLVMYGESVKGYGHANFGDDWDKIYRRQQLVARYSNTLGSIRLDQLDPSQEMVMGERLAGRPVTGNG
jgi:hypothetical protein